MPAKPTKSRKKRGSLLTRAAEIGMSVEALRVWQKLGVDVFDDESIRKYLRRARQIPSNIRDDLKPKVAAVQMPEDPTDIDIETIIRQLSAVTDKSQAQTVKLQIDGLLNAYKLREAAGKYVSRGTVEEALMRIAAAVKAAVMRMEADLPPMLDGASPAEMQRLIRGKVDEVMNVLADESSKVWEVAGDE